MKIKRTSMLSRIIRVFVPALLGLTMLSIAINYIVVRRLIHPQRTKAASTPGDYLEISNVQLPWSEEQWLNADNTQARGWVLRRGAGSSAVVLSHGYGSNRGDMLDLGVDLWKAGFTVLIYDLRGHGDSPVDWTSLGDYEVDDLLSALKFLKTIRDINGNPLVDASKIGLYGVSLGGYASVVAASRDAGVRSVVADSVYQTPDEFAQVLTKQVFGFKNKALNMVVDWGLQANFRAHFDRTSAVEAVHNYHDVNLLFIAAPDSAELRNTTGLVYIEAPKLSEITEVGHSHITRLYNSERISYNQLIVDFFKRGQLGTPNPQVKS